MASLSRPDDRFPARGDRMTAAPVSKLGFFEVRTRDVDRMATYYEQALGLVRVERSSSACYLTTGADHRCVVISEGDPHGRARLGFELAIPVDTAAENLRTAGVHIERRSDPEPGLADVLQLTEAVTGTPITLYERQAAGLGPAPASQCPTKLGHLAGFVSDLAKVRGFYEELLGFRWSDMVGDFFVFLRCNADHHTINLLQSATKSGLFHVAYEMRDMDHLKDALDALARQQIRLIWGPGRHGPGHNIFTYHRDSDGNIIELFTELDVVLDERTGQFDPRPWHETSPIGPQVWKPTDQAANSWGPLYPGFIDA
jgi:catechol-2,3-dioxygenase